MNAKDIINSNFESALSVTSAYLGDLTDQDLLTRPNPAANHTAWQLGHIICSGNQMLNAIATGVAPTLPEYFQDRYHKENAAENSAEKFHTKTQYLDLLNQQKVALASALEKLSDSNLDTPAPEAMRSYAPTLGMVGMLMGGHLMMHTGQIAVLRRMLNKPIVM
jgi:uncharacterized damage-inducible protein DinB